MSGQEKSFFTASSSVNSERILYTTSDFARGSLMYIQEVGSLTAVSPHTSRREKLRSFLCFAVLDGRGELCYEGVTYPLSKGDVVFIDCMEPYSHSTAPDKLWSLRWCHFYGGGTADIYDKYRERGGGAVIHPDDFEPYVGLLSELYETARGDDYIRDMRINEKLAALMTLLMNESWCPDRRITAPTKRMDIRLVRAHLDEHYSERITLESVAEHFFVNKHYLARLFKERYGVTLTIYLHQVRITHAKHMLRFTDKKIETIGMECGVGELPYFSRVFKKIEGISPSEYRRQW